MKIKKKLWIVFLLINLLMTVVYINNFEAKAALLNDMESQASSFISTGETNAENLTKVTTSITSNFTGLGQILTMIGAGVMVAVVSYMGIKYIISPPDKQAALKQQLIGVVAAGIVIFGAYGIWSAILKVVSKF